jgi:hypothetical protein
MLNIPTVGTAACSGPQVQYLTQVWVSDIVDILPRVVCVAACLQEGSFFVKIFFTKPSATRSLDPLPCQRSLDLIDFTNRQKTQGDPVKLTKKEILSTLFCVLNTLEGKKEKEKGNVGGSLAHAGRKIPNKASLIGCFTRSVDSSTCTAVIERYNRNCRNTNSALVNSYCDAPKLRVRSCYII